MFAFFSPVSVSAETKAGIGPSSFFYIFDTTFENINLFFTFNSEKKAKKALVYAEERLAEAEESANKNDQKAVKKAIDGYEKKISLAVEKSKELKDKKKSEELLNTISESTVKHQEVLESVLEKVPDVAKEAIFKAIEVSKQGQEKELQEIAVFKEEAVELKNENYSQAEEILRLKKEASVAQAEAESERLKAEKARAEAEAVRADTERQLLQAEIDRLKATELTAKKEQEEVEKGSYCNGKYWSQCSVGQKFYCPATGDAKCLIEDKVSDLVIENPQIKIEKCKAQRDKSMTSYETIIPEMVNLLTQKFSISVIEMLKPKADAGINVLPTMTTILSEYRISKTKELKVKFRAEEDKKYLECLDN